MTKHYINPENAGKLADALRKGKTLADQWPKHCGCGRTHTKASWAQLPEGKPFSDEYADHEQRHCVCGSTLVILTKIHDLSKE